MRKFVIKDSYYFEVKEMQGRFVIIPNEDNIFILKEILEDDKKNFHHAYIDIFVNTQIPLSWIKKEFIQDEEFVEKYHPEYLI